MRRGRLLLEAGRHVRLHCGHGMPGLMPQVLQEKREQERQDVRVQKRRMRRRGSRLREFGRTSSEPVPNSCATLAGFRRCATWAAHVRVWAALGGRCEWAHGLLGSALPWGRLPLLRRAQARRHTGLRRRAGLGCHDVHHRLRWGRPALGLPNRPDQLECVVQLCGPHSD